MPRHLQAVPVARSDRAAAEARRRTAEEERCVVFLRRRLERGEKLHLQSLGATAHLDYNQAGAHSYEQALLVIRRLGLSMDDIEEQFRRMAFNVLARNQDDHVKNIAFLMDRRGKWSLSPAFDLNYSYNPDGAWTATHQMSLNGKRDGFTLDDFEQVAKTASMKRGRAKGIVGEVVGAVSTWRECAAEAGVPDSLLEQIAGAHRLSIRGSDPSR